MTEEDASRVLEALGLLVAADNVDDVVGAIIAAASAVTASVPSSGDPRLLTERERIVLALAAAGLADRQIARQMGISPRTVGKHLQHVYRKTGTNNRIQAVRILA